ncbi:PDDEXK nuclease domain-containing protein [Sansalvadorimonas sp. 2012CJ34-2]|uniref:PDDEXK nuclease domain-containing protein n=1 Tax=Parendozoicomonas callyspongiae TaxID=2942213 RepID=A0ABT0PHA7_9GAMM|nr:PDDEXK nuclease domain-containing protein [Sansalvadorimonas sp. 2012CJ34-2]MCL6270762.1 PDDEXK nuclease domain-containing protein [Sansalvadorimonas sp. 2012CJ34-2]
MPTHLPDDYRTWLQDIKGRIQKAQQGATFSVNRHMIMLYWQIGREILERQSREGWGSQVVKQLAKDLKASFPGMKGFSRANLMYMRAFAESWPDFHTEENVQQAVGQIPWSHNLLLLSKLKERSQRLFYAAKTLENGWSRNVLLHQIESRLVERQGKAVSNFPKTLPSPQSDLVQQTLKDPYLFDFLSLGESVRERDLEKALTRHISQFLLELGAGFAYVGQQVHLNVGGDDFYVDLLFYHLKLRCYIVVELKTGDFKPEHVGQLNFYLSAVDSLIKTEEDAPSIGLLLCKDRNKVVAEYALRDNTKPIGIAEYQLAQSLPDELEGSLPSIEQLEKEALSLPADDEM